MGLRSQKGAENPTTKCYGEAFVGILVFLKGIIPHIIELKQSKCRVGYGELLLWPARKPKGVGARGKGKVAFSYTLWLPLPRKRGISSKENESPVTGPGLDVQIQVCGASRMLRRGAFRFDCLVPETQRKEMIVRRRGLW